ncbi:uncharacterized protein LOC130969643 [Arachis stenosperma]|uniref:uncharacterized protein LOC130969643 n=1 Tax=Arachis stenosperma TaxID=217475 RepID=UPI0025ACB18B|nr:uncharacterized protein LOC130969643 [Arachis stenosperma]
MGSLGEEDLVRMVQDFIESESTPPTMNSNSSNCRSLNHQNEYFILQDILRSSETAAESKILNCVMKHMRSRHATSEKTTTSNLKTWLVKRLKMDGFNASLCQTSWPTSLGCPAGEYEYIEVIVEGDKNSEVRVIVDIDFRCQFELARPTEYYKEMTESLPVVFVGSEKKLCNIISLMCSAAKKSLREKGLHVPPWRTTRYMQSKWLCRSHPNNNTATTEGANNNNHNNAHVFGNWVPPTVRPRRRDLDGGGSALSSQFSNMGVNCCYV